MSHTRNLIVIGMFIVTLAGCGQATPLNVSPTNTPPPPAYATAMVVLTSVAEGSEAPIEPATAGQIPTATAIVEPAADTSSGRDAPVVANVANAEQTVRTYFTAFGEQRAAEAWALLAPAMQAQMTYEMFESTTLAVQSLSVARIDSVLVADQRLIYGVTVEATPVPGLPTRWAPGPNRLYVTVINTPEGWRIAAITDEPPSL